VLRKPLYRILTDYYYALPKGVAQWRYKMTPNKHSGTGTHLRIYTSEGLVTAFNIDMDPIEFAEEIFDSYVRR